jgi:integrase
MAQSIRRLTTMFCRTVTKPGYHADGGGLYLCVKPSGAKSWVFIYEIAGKRRECGLGSYKTVALGEAREKALECRRMRLDGRDPIEEKRKTGLQARASRTFRQCVDGIVKDKKAGWRSEKHQKDWVNSLLTHACPVIGDLPVSAIDTAAVLRVLKPIWEAKTVTADRVRNRIELVLAWATTHGYRQGDNPARWPKHLENVLAKKSKLVSVQHLAALPYQDAPALIARLREHDGIVAAALEFAILTVTRSNEVLGARWDEIDPVEKLWTIPPERMKGHREHRVPLTPAMLAVLDRMERDKVNSYIFPGRRRDGMLHEHALLDLLRQLAPGVTVHGLRSMHTDWAAEAGYPRELRELALAHKLDNATEAAYRRSDLAERRRRLSEAWERYLSGHIPETVITLPQRAVAV